MPSYNVTAPDGTSYTVNAPDGATEQDAIAYVQKNLYKPKEQEKINYAEGMGFGDKLLTGVGAGMAEPERNRMAETALGAVRGVADIGNTLLKLPGLKQLGQLGYEALGGTGQREDSLNALDQSNKDSNYYSGGRLAGNILATAPVGGILGAGAARVGLPALGQALTTGGLRAGGAGLGTRMAGGAITGAASAGLVNPDDALAGGAIGAALPAGVMGAGKLGGAIWGKIRPAIDPLVQKAMQLGMPLGVADIMTSPIVKGIRSVLGDIPIVRTPGIKSQGAKQEWLNKAVGNSFGESAANLTPEVMDAAKKRMGGEFNRIWGKNTLTIDPQFVDDLTRIENDAISKLNPEQATQVRKQIQNLLSKMDGDSINGGFANNWQSELRMIADSEKGLHQKLLKDLRGAALGAFNRNIPADDAAKLATTKSQYKAFKTVEPLMAKGELGVAGREMGDVPAALLPNAVFQQYGSGASRTPLGEAAQLGSRFVADRVAQTGGSPRALVQNSFLGGLLGAASLGSPWALIAAPAAYGANRALNSPAAGRLMASQMPQIIPNIADDYLRLAPQTLGLLGAPMLSQSTLAGQQ